MKLKKFFSNNVTDCYICVIRPLLFIGGTVIYITTTVCPHKDNVKNQKFVLNTNKTVIAIIWLSILVAEMILIIHYLFKADTAVEKKAHYIFTFPNLINTFIFTLSVILYNKRYIQLSNGLLALIERRKLYGIDTFLTKKISKYFTIYSFFVSFTNSSVFVAQLLFFLFKMSNFELDYICLTIAMFVNSVNGFNYAVYFITTVGLYYIMLKKMMRVTEEALKKKDRRLLDKLKNLHRFYLALIFNYKNHIFGFGNVFLYMGQFVYIVFAIGEQFLNHSFFNNKGDWFWMFYFRIFFINYSNAWIMVYYWITKKLLLVVSINS